MRAAHNSDAERLRLIRLLHVAKRDLCMEDADYRAVLSRVSEGTHNSAKDLDILELEAAIKHMKRCGFKVRTKGSPAPAKARSSRPLAGDPESKKIRALWLMLHQLGRDADRDAEKMGAALPARGRGDNGPAGARIEAG